MKYLLLFPTANVVIHWFEDEHGFLDYEIVEL